MEFKVGQTVKVIDNVGMVASLGATAIVTRGVHTEFEMSVLDVEWKTNFNYQINGGYRPYHFKSVITKGQQLLFAFMDE